MAASDVDALLTGDTTAIVPLITMMAKAYTRGHGFDDDEPNDEIAAVITTASARLAANPKQLSNTETAGPYNQNVVGGFTGWTLAEQFVLNRYRKRAM
jgi:hypothetical protein